MARFSNKIESFRYVDSQHKSIEILYKTGDTINSYYIEVDFNNQDFLDFLEEYSIEEVEDQTKIYYDNINTRKQNIIFDKATEMFESWVKNAQVDLDKQDEERYKLFEEYKEEQVKILNKEADAQVEERYKKADVYKEEQLLALQSEIEERYKEADVYKEEQLKILQVEIDTQIENRYKEADEYKEQQLEILQKEIDKQIEGRFKEADTYKEEQLSILQNELNAQVEERYKEADKYKEQQLEILQKELDDQAEGRFKEADEYKEEQLKILQSEVDEQIESKYQEVEGMKTDLLKKFNIGSPSAVRYTPEKVAKYIIDNFEDEDTVFKTKLEIFNLPEVKNSKDREMKMKVRKAKTVPEIFAAYYDIQHSHS